MDKQQEMLSGVLSMCYGDISGVQQKEAPFFKKLLDQMFKFRVKTLLIATKLTTECVINSDYNCFSRTHNRLLLHISEKKELLCYSAQTMALVKPMCQ